MLDDSRATPAHTKYDGAELLPHVRWVLFGHHFAAITGSGPLVGPMLRGAVRLGARADLARGGSLPRGRRARLDDSGWASTRRGARSLSRSSSSRSARSPASPALIAILFIIVVTLAGLGIIVVNALADSAWGTFTISMTIPHRHVHGLLDGVWRKGASPRRP
jgi:carbon starvation protein